MPLGNGSKRGILPHNVPTYLLEPLDASLEVGVFVPGSSFQLVLSDYSAEPDPQKDTEMGVP